MSMREITVGHFPYAPGFNPYQKLFADGLEAAGMKVVRIPPRKKFPLKWAMSHPVDILHLDWPHSWYTGRTWLLTRVKRMMYHLDLHKLRTFPCVWTLHNLVGHDTADLADEIRMIQKLVDSIDAVMVMSRAAQELFRQHYRIPDRVRIEVVPMGHYIDAYPNDIDRADARSKLNIAMEARVVLFLGRIQPYKGVDRLIEAFGAVAASGDILLLAGPAPPGGVPAEMDAMIRRCCPEGAEIRIEAGFIPDEELQVYYQASDVAAMPFRNILNSSMLMTAMSFGRCSVAPAMGSLPEVAYPRGLFGYDPEDPHGLERALGEALEQKDLLLRGEETKEFVRRSYDWVDNGRKLRTLYEEILQQYQPSDATTRHIERT
jgi:glycosyltransferase involved in cell wall biosynthesis